MLTTNTARNPESFDYMKPYIETLLFDCLVPLMFVKLSDIKTFREEPITFIHNETYYE